MTSPRNPQPTADLAPWTRRGGRRGRREQPTPSAAKSLRQNLLSTGIAIMALPAASLIASPLLSRALGPAGRGEYASVAVPLVLAVSMATGGVLEAVVYFLARLAAPKRPVLLSSAAALGVMSAGVTGALCLLSGVLSAGSGEVRRLIIYSSFSIPVYASVVLARAFAAARQQWRLVNAERYLSAFTRLAGFAGLFVLDRLTLGSAVLVVVLSTLLPGVVYIRRGCLTWPRAGRPEVARTFRGREYIRYTAINWLAGVSAFLLSKFDQAALAPLAGAVALGLYAVAASIAEVPQLLTWAAREVLLSHDAHLEDTDGVVRTSRAIFTVTGLFCLVIAGCVPWAIPLLFGRDFGGAVVMTEVLLISIVLAAPGNVLSAALVARGRARSRTVAVVAAVIVDVALLVVLAPVWGGLGAAYAMLGSALVGTTVTVTAFCGMTGRRWVDVLLPRSTDLRSLVKR